MLWPKKNSYKEFDNEKKFLRLENSPPPPPPPHNFSNGPSLSLLGRRSLSLALPFFLASFTSDRLPRRLDLIEFNCCAPVYTVNFRL